MSSFQSRFKMIGSVFRLFRSGLRITLTANWNQCPGVAGLPDRGVGRLDPATDAREAA